MRDLKRNQQKIYYCLFLGSVPETDEDGNETGSNVSKYSNPVRLDTCVSATKGDSQANAFGISLDYDKTMSISDTSVPIDEFTRLFVDSMPILNEDGSTDSEPDYIVKKVAKSLNGILYAIKKEA